MGLNLLASAKEKNLSLIGDLQKILIGKIDFFEHKKSSFSTMIKDASPKRGKTQKKRNLESGIRDTVMSKEEPMNTENATLIQRENTSKEDGLSQSGLKQFLDQKLSPLRNRIFIILYVSLIAEILWAIITQSTVKMAIAISAFVIIGVLTLVIHILCSKQNHEAEEEGKTMNYQKPISILVRITFVIGFGAIFFLLACQMNTSIANPVLIPHIFISLELFFLLAASLMYNLSASSKILSRVISFLETLIFGACSFIGFVLLIFLNDLPLSLKFMLAVIYANILFEELYYH